MATDKSQTTPDPADVALGAAAIIDIWMGGRSDWRTRLDTSEFLQSADWQSATNLSEAVLKATQR